MYLDYVIQAQIMPISNLPPDLDLETYKFWDNEVLIYTPLYSSQNGLYRGLRKKLGYVTLRGDTNETFYSYGLDKERSKTLFCVNKQPLPNIFQCTAFKNHWSFLLDQNQENLEFSKIFMSLPSILGRKEKLQQYNNNVNLHPIDVSYDHLKALNNHSDFNPADLENNSLRRDIT